MKLAIALAVTTALAAAVAGSVDARARHGIKRGAPVAQHLRIRHPAAGLIYGHPLSPVPSAYPYGGPLYSTCDRINADRLLVGTCR